MTTLEAAKQDETKIKAVENDEEPIRSFPSYTVAGPTLHQNDYFNLSHCLRTNIFPGAPTTWRSLTRESYISHPPTPRPADPNQWHGHKTDDVVQWTERNILNQKLKKLLTQKEKDPTTK